MKHIGILTLAVFWLANQSLLHAQAGEQMKDYDKVFGVVLGKAPHPYDVTLLEDKTSEGNVLAPGQQPVLSFLVTNNTDQPVQTSGKIDIIRYGARGISGDQWYSQVIKFEDIPALPIEVNVPAKGSQIIEVNATLPETFGAYAFIFDLGSRGRRFALSVVRTFAPAPQKIQFPIITQDVTVGISILKSLGIQAVRMEVGWIPAQDPNYATKMAELDAKLKTLFENNITVMLTVESGQQSYTEALGRLRPFLNDQAEMSPVVGDTAWLPQYDPDFQKFVAHLCTKYGWPNGPVTALQLYNEPWEGTSISGWGADLLRYREIYTAMAQGIEEARKNGTQVLIVGCDSSSNAWDKLFPDGTDAYLKWFDASTIHYQGLWSPALYKMWRNRTGSNGRVKIWDTESWIANSDNRIATMVASDRAAGYDRVMGVFHDNISLENHSKVKMPDGTTKKLDVFFPWSPAAALGAAQHFLGQREFSELLFQNGLPWVMVFHGLDNHPEDGTIVVAGDLREEFDPNQLLFRNVKGLAQLKLEDQKDAVLKQIAALPSGWSRDRIFLKGKLKGMDVLSGGSLTFPDPANEFVLYDFYGNPIPPKNGMVEVPLNGDGFYLRCNSAPGSFDRLRQAIAGGRIEGYEPLNIAAHDFLTTIEQKPVLRLTLTNILNRPVSGSVEVSVKGLKLNVPAKIDFQPNETKDVLIPVVGGESRPDNTYSLSVKFDAGADGYALFQEKLHVNLIAKRTITVDGNLEDWKGVLPQPIYAEGDEGPSQIQLDWQPFRKFDAKQKPGFASGYLAYDDKNFYFAAKIADDTSSPGTIRFAKRNDDAYFYPDVSYAYDPQKVLWKKETVWNEPSRAPAALLLPGSTTQRSFTAWTPSLTGGPGAFAIDFDLPTDAEKQVSFYFVDWAPTGMPSRQLVVEAHDIATGKLLAQAQIMDYGKGCYATFLLAGKVRVVFRGQSNAGASLSGFFFDSSNDGKKPGVTPSARFVALDTTTGGHWQGKYGQEGYNVFGADAHYPAYAKIEVPDVHEKTAYHWPEGVRHYTYRKNPDLPFGADPKLDNVQIAFNVIPIDQKDDVLATLPGVMAGFMNYKDTDYEYALNQVAESYGGGTEIWRCRVPGMPSKHFYPRQPTSPLEGAVTSGQLAAKHDTTTRIVEAAIPWTEIPLVKKALDDNRTIKFSFRVNDDKGPAMELAEGRSVSKENAYTFHPDYVAHWANEVEFSFEK